MGPCNSGYWTSPAASPVDTNGRRRCCGSQGRVPCGACIFAPFIWSATACPLNRLHGLPDALHCSYPVSEKSARRRAPFLGNHDTFWRSSLPRRALQTRARRLAREGPSFTVRTCTTAGGAKMGGRWTSQNKDPFAHPGTPIDRFGPRGLAPGIISGMFDT